MSLSPLKIADSESGLLLVNKPTGWTSHDVVNFARRRFGFKKVGHCGTLDPSATGLLILVIGHATKIAQYLSDEDKVYRTVLEFGRETDSHDMDGETVRELPWQHLDETSVRNTLLNYQGPQKQVPPMVSALKKDGKKLYELARKGISVEREARSITVHEIAINSVNLPEVDFTIRCSKGTYVRTVCHDIGLMLNTAAYMKSLVRLKSGGFDLDDASEIESMKNWEKEEFLAKMIPLATFITQKSLHGV